MGNYTNTYDVWRNLGKEAWTKVRAEIVGTGDGSTSVFDVSHDNIISGSTAIYVIGIESTSGVSYNYDDGKATFGSAPASGSEITLDYGYTEFPDSIAQDIVSQAEEDMEDMTGRKFYEVTSNTEYYDWNSSEDELFLNNYPVTTLTSVARNKNGITDTPDWETLSSGIGNDYLFNDEDKAYARIRFIDNKPFTGKDTIKVEYDYGFTSVPYKAKELAVLLSLRQMINSTIYKSIYTGKDDYSPVRLEEINLRIENLTKQLSKQNIESP